MTDEVTPKTQLEGPVRFEEVWVDDQQRGPGLKIPWDLETRDVLLGLANRWAEMRLSWAAHTTSMWCPDFEMLDRRIQEIAALAGPDAVERVVDQAIARFGRKSELIWPDSGRPPTRLLDRARALGHGVQDVSELHLSREEER